MERKVTFHSSTLLLFLVGTQAKMIFSKNIKFSMKNRPASSSSLWSEELDDNDYIKNADLEIILEMANIPVMVRLTDKAEWRRTKLSS